MTEFGSVAVNVEALQTANVATQHPYASSEFAWVPAQLGKERAALLAGASGAIGRRLTPLLHSAGHNVCGSTKSNAKPDVLRSLGADPVVVIAFGVTVIFLSARRYIDAPGLRIEPRSGRAPLPLLAGCHCGLVSIAARHRDGDIHDPCSWRSRRTRCVRTRWLRRTLEGTLTGSGYRSGGIAARRGATRNIPPLMNIHCQRSHHHEIQEPR